MNNFLKRSLILLLMGTVIFIGCKKEDPIPELNVQFQSASGSVAENAGTFNIPLVLPGAAQGTPTIVKYTVGGTAKPTDFTIDNSGTATIPANANSVNIPVKITNNVDQDGNRTISLTITSVTLDTKVIPLATLNQTYTLTITDDECSPYIAGTWAYTARYFSILNGVEIPAGQNGQALDEEQNKNPDFKGTITITDPDKKRAYVISDAAVGQFAALRFTATGTLLDNCGKLSTPTDKPILLAGAIPVVLTGTITNANTITVTWDYYADPQLRTKAGRGQATLTKQ